MTDRTAGLCDRCTYHTAVRSDRGKYFHRCGYSDINKSFPKYPMLPVLECPAFSSIDKRGEDEQS